MEPIEIFKSALLLAKIPEPENIDDIYRLASLVSQKGSAITMAEIINEQNPPAYVKIVNDIVDKELTKYSIDTSEPENIPTYYELAAKWIKENNVQVGTQVLVANKPTPEQLTIWHNLWEPSMDDYVGNRFAVEEISPSNYIKIGVFYFPYYSLKIE